MRCSWCKDPNAEINDGTLCSSHRAEAEGITEDQADKRDAVQFAEWLDTLN